MPFDIARDRYAAWLRNGKSDEDAAMAYEIDMPWALAEVERLTIALADAKFREQEARKDMQHLERDARDMLQDSDREARGLRDRLEGGS